MSLVDGLIALGVVFAIGLAGVAVLGLSTWVIVVLVRKTLVRNH